MPFQELYSKLKNKQQKANQPVIYEYDEIPDRFRHQVVHIWMDAIGPYEHWNSKNGVMIWDNTHKLISRELGLSTLGRHHINSENCIQFLFEQDVDHVLDIIQVSFSLIELYFGEYNDKPQLMYQRVGLSYPPNIAIQELNFRFLENELGYQYQNGQIIRIDSQFTHSEIALPALQLLNDQEFTPALNEFLSAYKHYGQGNYEAAINEALKAFESTMKIIVTNKDWSTDSNATASKLIQICIENQLIPSSMNSHFTGFRTTLESGLPTIRNKFSGHGDGVETVSVPAYLVQYALNLAASNIVLLIKAYRDQ